MATTGITLASEGIAWDHKSRLVLSLQILIIYKVLF